MLRSFTTCHLGVAMSRIVLRVVAALLLAGAGLIVSPPARAADLFTELRTFPGVALLPPSDLSPFSQLEPWRVELNRPRPGSTAIIHGRYLVQYREPGGGTGSGQVGGSMGRDDMDQMVTALATRSFTRCPADAPYCVENVAGQDGAAPASEVFRGLRVNDGEAVVEHVVCCGGHYWSLTWYDGPRDMTYNLVLVGTIADDFGSTISQDNSSTAARLAGLAEKLKPLE
jgi:hypothetical protein